MKILLLILIVVKVAAEKYPCQEYEGEDLTREINEKMRNYWALYDFDTMSVDEIEAAKKRASPDLYICKHNILNKAGFNLASHIRNHLIDNFPLESNDGHYVIPLPIPQKIAYDMSGPIFAELAKYGYYITKGAIVHKVNDTHSYLTFPIHLEVSEKIGGPCKI